MALPLLRAPFAPEWFDDSWVLLATLVVEVLLGAAFYVCVVERAENVRRAKDLFAVGVVALTVAHATLGACVLPDTFLCRACQGFLVVTGAAVLAALLATPVVLVVASEDRVAQRAALWLIRALFVAAAVVAALESILRGGH
jgi:hypothetical protein